MREMMFLTIGFLTGSLNGIVLMCLLQIKHIGKTSYKKSSGKREKGERKDVKNQSMTKGRS